MSLDTERIATTAAEHALTMWDSEGEVAPVLLLHGGIELTLILGDGDSKNAVTAIGVLCHACGSTGATYVSEAWMSESDLFDHDPEHGEMEALAATGDPRVWTSIVVCTWDLTDPTNDHTAAVNDLGGRRDRTSQHGLAAGGLSALVHDAARHPLVLSRPPSPGTIPALLAALAVRGVILAVGLDQLDLQPPSNERKQP